MTDPSTSNCSPRPDPSRLDPRCRVSNNPAILEALRKAALFAQWRARVYAEMPEEIRPPHWKKPGQ